MQDTQSKQQIAQLNEQVVQLYEQGRYEEAIDPATQFRDLIGQLFGKEHPRYATSLNNLAGLYESMGRYAKAEPLYEKALEIRRLKLGEDHPDVAASLNNLAGLYESMGRYAKAEPLYEKALEIWRLKLGEDHPNVATSLNNLAGLYIATARATEALPLMQQAASIHDQVIGQIFSVSSENQRTAYLKTVEGAFHAFLSLISQYFPASLTAVRTALDLVLRRKAIEAEALATQRDAVLGGQYPEIAPKLRQLTILGTQIRQKKLLGPGPEGFVAHHQQIAEWEAQKDRLEAELARQIPEMNLELKLRAADRQAIARAMPAGVVLVEVVRFDVFDFKAVPAHGERGWQPARYLAFVVPAGEPDNVHMIDLGEAEPIDRLITAFRESITVEDENSSRSLTEKTEIQHASSFKEAGNRLRAVVFDPLIPAFGGCEHLLLSPDGDLTRLPFEVLPMSDGSYFIDKYHISYLSSGRDVLRFGVASSGQPTAPIVVADPDFDLTGVPVTTSAESHSSHDQRTPSTSSRRSRDLDSAHLHFDRLPGTRVEGERVAAMSGVQPWLADAALEARLKACQSPRILHLGTHGFVLPNQQRDLNQERRTLEPLDWQTGSGIRRLSGPGMENPMLRSGVALAGANTFLEAGSLPSEAEDGLLTAEDVSGLNLLNTDLAVLSACNTGLGEVRTGEGVFGLRRAFVLAGAKTLIMSLWKVDDLATAILMEKFYDNLLNQGRARDESLRKAQGYLRRVTLGEIRGTWLSAEMIERLTAGNERAKARLQELAQFSDDTFPPFRDPFYWGAFICQGDPAALPWNGDAVETQTAKI